MAGKNSAKENVEYDRLREDLKAGTPKRLYAFWGEERYLLENCLALLRAMIPRGTEGFNHRRLEGGSMALEDLKEAIDAFPAFSEFTLTEVWDLDLNKLNEGERQKLTDILSDIPDYACVVFVFDTVEFKLDGRVKANQALKKLFTAVEFTVQEETALTKWMRKHFRKLGLDISGEAAHLLITMTGGQMTALRGEILKLAAYCGGNMVEPRDVEAVVTPVLDAQIYNLTDAIISGRGDAAIERLGELLQMNEAPHKLLFSISLRLRQLLVARILLNEGSGTRTLMEMSSIRYDFQARAVMTLARKVTLRECRELIALTTAAAYKLNSSPQDSEELLVEYVIRVMALVGAGR